MSVKCSRLSAVAWWVVTVATAVSAGRACLTNPCVHGICIDDVDSEYSCYCMDGYTGVECQTNWDECWSGPCQNGGTCIDGIAAYNCSCPEGFIGDNCEINYNECESNPCQNNGTCVDMANGYVCACAPGYSGRHCEVDVAVCDVTGVVRCHNGGQCIEGPGFRFYCKCAPGWAGKKCEDEIDECKSNPCQNGGVCIDVYADYMCACTYGEVAVALMSVVWFTGKSCEVQIEFCDNNTCSKNALCVVEDGARVCYCVPDFHGERCELQYDECALGPRCTNGGTCIDGVDNFTCSCPPRLTGSLCECLILDDGTHFCDYVSPTPLTDLFTTGPYLTTYMKGQTSTELVTSTLGYNDTIPKTKPEVPDAEPSDTPSTDAELTTASDVTTIDMMTETTTDEMDFVTETFPITEETTVSVEVVTNEVTLVSGDEKTETTTKDMMTETTTDQNDFKTETYGGEETTTEYKGRSETETTLPTTPKFDATVSTVSETTVPIEATTKQITTETVQTTEQSTELTTVVTDIDTTKKETTEATTTTPKTDVTTEKKMDTTTEKMFTDAPTEHNITDVPLPTVSSTTEEIDTSTRLETTVSPTTDVADCDDSRCNDHGSCVNSQHGVRCHCAFNYAGRFCEEKLTIASAAFGENSYVSHAIRNDTSIFIEFTAKTLKSDGQIMFVDIAKGVYMQLYMDGGLLKFKFSCGYQTMLLSELKTFVNKGYSMKIETRLDLYLKEQHCNATLRLNDTLAMSGGQVAKIGSLDHNTTLYLGNYPKLKDHDIKPFVGCIKDLVVNGEKVAVFGDAIDGSDVTECLSLSCLSSPCLNGGSCKDEGDGYNCSCANGWMGHHCNQSVCDFNPCQSGGSCVHHPGSGFLCLCPYGKHGIFCDYNLEITRPSLSPIGVGISSFLVYPLSSSAMNSDRFDLRLRFQTADMEQISLLAFVGQNGRHDSYSQHLALTFVKGYIMLTWNMGNGPRRVFTARALMSRRGGHAVRVWRRGRSAGLSVDGRHNVTGNAPLKHSKMTLLPYLYIGGHPSAGFTQLPHDLPLHSGFSGCVLEVGGQALGSGKALAGRGVGQCGVAQCTSQSCNSPRGVCVQSPASYGCICNEGWFGATCSATVSPCDGSANRCKGRCVITSNGAHCDCPYGKTGVDCDQELIPTDVLFTGTRSFVQLHPQPVSSLSVSLEMEIRPSKERGVLVFTETPDFYTALSLQGGLLEYRWTDGTSGLTSVVRSGVVVSMGQWHKVKAGRYGSRLYVWADGALATEPMVAHAYPHTAANATVLLGGASDLSTLPFDAVSGPPESYHGCIRHVHVNNVLLPLEQHNIKEGRNLADCDGTPCGVEVCGGGTCTVEGARARCVCPSGGVGSRCRRHAACSAAVCKPPNGWCRKGRCVCSAGYVGDYCERRITVSVPQFDGESFLSPTRHGASALFQRAGAQRVGRNVPSSIHLNFTTAEAHGLLLWIAMDVDYIGLGLEKGFLKLVWSFYPSNSTIEVLSAKIANKEPSGTFSRLVPHAGYLADAEWHALDLRIQKNITVTVDQLLAFEDDSGLKENDTYGDVDVFVGGTAEKESVIARKLFPRNFQGCIDQISLAGSAISDYTEVYSENVQSCQLFP